MWNANRTTSRFEAHLVYNHTQKPDFLISNTRYYSRFYGMLTKVGGWAWKIQKHADERNTWMIPYVNRSAWFVASWL